MREYVDFENVKKFLQNDHRPVIEDAIRRAALERGVRVRLLFSDWDHTKVRERIYFMMQMT